MQQLKFDRNIKNVIPKNPKKMGLSVTLKVESFVGTKFRGINFRGRMAKKMHFAGTNFRASSIFYNSWVQTFADEATTQRKYLQNGKF